MKRGVGDSNGLKQWWKMDLIQLSNDWSKTNNKTREIIHLRLVQDFTYNW